MLPIGRCFNLMSERGQTKNGYTCLVDAYSNGVLSMAIAYKYIVTFGCVFLLTDTCTLSAFSPCSILLEGLRIFYLQEI